MGQQQSGQPRGQAMDHFAHRFTMNKHPTYRDSESLMLLHEKLTSKQYVLVILTNNDDIEKQKLQELLCRKLASPSGYIIPLEQYMFEEKNGYCSKVSKCYTIFKLDEAENLKHHLVKRQCESKQGFTDEQLMQMTQDVTSALLWLKYVNHPHGNLSTESIYWNHQEGRFLLSDPWIAPLRDPAGPYPSPQKLMRINNEIDTEDLYQSDIFSLGMVILECMIGVPTGVYKPNYKIDKKRLVDLINIVENPQLKERLRIMLVGSHEEKQVFMKRLQQNMQASRTRKVSPTGYHPPSKLGFARNEFPPNQKTSIISRVSLLEGTHPSGRDEQQKPSMFYGGNPNIKNGIGFSDRPPIKPFNLSNPSQQLTKLESKPKIEFMTNTNTNGFQKMSRISSQSNLQARNRTNSGYTELGGRKTIQLGGQFEEQSRRAQSRPKNDTSVYTPFFDKQKTALAKSQLYFGNDSSGQRREMQQSPPNPWSTQGTYPSAQPTQRLPSFLPNYSNVNQKTYESAQLWRTPNTQPTVTFGSSLVQQGATKKFQPTSYISKQHENIPTQLTPGVTPKQSKASSGMFNSQGSDDGQKNAQIYNNKLDENMKKLEYDVGKVFSAGTTSFTQNPSQMYGFGVGKGPLTNESGTGGLSFLKGAKSPTDAKMPGAFGFDNILSSASGEGQHQQRRDIRIQQDETESMANTKFSIKNEESRGMNFYLTPEGDPKQQREKIHNITKPEIKRETSSNSFGTKGSPQAPQNFNSHSPPTKPVLSKAQSQESYSYSESNTSNSGSLRPININNLANSQQDFEEGQMTPPARQGSQLETVNNLTIPEESDEDSDSSRRRRSRGAPVQELYENGGRYKGYVYNGKRDGEGTFYYKDGGYYTGCWKNNMMNGYGKLYYDTGKLAYEGYWYKDEFHGRGKVYNDSPQSLNDPFDYSDFENIELYWQYYEGDLVHDSKEGFGKIMLSNGQSFEGEFRGDKVHGKGTFKTKNGDLIKGVWNNCKLEKILN